MKKVLAFLTLVYVFTLVSCKKETITPTPPSPQPDITDTTDVNDTTTVNDTVGKFKIFYELNLDKIITTLDYQQDTSKVRVYHNNTLLNNHVVIMAGNDLSIINNKGSDVVINGVDKPVWASVGDSIVIELDHLEYTSFSVCGMVATFTRNLQVDMVENSNDFDLNGYRDNEATDPDLGSYNNGGQISYWKLGGKYRIVYHIL